VSNTDTWKGPGAIEATLAHMGTELAAMLAARDIERPLMIGIHTGGVWVAERLHRDLGLAEPLGHLDISFYRDDFTRIGSHPQVRPSHLPVPIDDRHLILVDDVLQTGRTIRAALNVLFDYGRPASVLLVTLVERDGRELPIAADLVGLHARLEPGQQLKLTAQSPGSAGDGPSLALVLGETPKDRQKRAKVSAEPDAQS
jgi:pyrimidine operon attenuation protein / uracil phosphoribosyltransferase